MLKLRSFLVMLTLSVLLAGQAMAQITSSNLRGQVVSSDGTAIEGASVEILHVPSSTVARTTTSETGQFFQSGLRVGGPYQLTVTGSGYEATVFEDLFLEPGNQDPIRVSLSGVGDVTDRVLVTGTRMVEAAELNSGVGSVYSSQDIRNSPGGDRDLIGVLLQDPLATSSGQGTLSIAGVNPRLNGLAIDGALQQDDFGLGDSTYATARSPINIDTVESISLVASDYSVQASGFTGGLVNVVTRSGGNDWEGNFYYAMKNDSMIGDKYGDRTFDPGEVDEKEYGFVVSGPVIEDKLFVLFSYDEYDTGAPYDFSNSDAVSGREAGFFDALNTVINDVYGFDALSRPVSGNIPETSERTLAKVDWNINDAHRASFTYQKTQETGTSISGNNFQSAWYDIPVDLDAYTVQLFSDWTPNLSTTVRYNYKEFVRGQICRGGPEVGHLEFRLGPDDLIGSPLEGLLTGRSITTVAGCDRFRHANEYNDDRAQLFASADYFMGDHVITFGTEYEEFNLFNMFVPASRGRFVFNDYDQIASATAGNIDYVNTTSNNARDGAAAWGYEKMNFFIADEWSISPDLQLSLGLRYERYSQDDAPVFSQDIFDTYGVNTTSNLDGKDLFMPRVGFLFTGWDRTTISGGFGLFAGGSPQVWISNAFQVPTNFARVTNFSPVDAFNVPQELRDAVAGGGAGTPIDYIDEDFEIPSDWKASLRYERSFDLPGIGDNFRFTAQYLYTRTNDGFLWRNIAQTQLADALPTGVAPDGRPIYADLNALGIGNLTQLTNYTDGDSHVITLGLGKVFENGFDFNVAYAYQDTTVVSEGSSSRGISSWRGQYDEDRNFPSPRTSPYQVDHAIKINFGYENRFFGDLLTRVDAFGQITAGTTWGATFDINPSNHLFGRAGLGEGPFDNNPLYIPDPAGDSRAVFGSGFDQAAFFAFVDQENLPTGQIMAPYSRTSKWDNIWDLRFQQELPGIPGLDRFAKDNKFSVVLDIDNFLNLLNKDWGQYRSGPRFGQAAIAQADLVSAADVAANGVDGATALTGDASRTTCQAASDCVYRFTNFRGQSTSFTSGPRSVWQARLTFRYDF